MSVTHARGFRAAGVTAGIKASGAPDVALVVADGPASAAGVFTRSRTAAAPVALCRAVLAAGAPRRGVLVTAGNANAATGARGVEDARRMAALAGAAVGAGPQDVLVCSTGVIGVPLPMERVEAGIASAARALHADGGPRAAEAILTTDAWPKEASRSVEIDGRRVRLGGMAKGAGMIRPDLGTMIAVVTTDASVEPATLHGLLAGAAAATFNRVSVDGCTSTNDALVALAGGASGAVVRTPAAVDGLGAALEAVCRDLALGLVRDGEGARRIGRWEVVGARSDDEADRAARRVAEDQLVRCALHGGDPNWGRIVAALGVCGAEVDPGRIGVAIGGVAVCRDGVAVPGHEPEAAAAARADEVHAVIDLGLGTGRATVWGSDLSAAYVRLNAEYTT